MGKVNKKAILKRAKDIENGWETAPDVKFRKKSLSELKAKLTALSTKEDLSADLETQKKVLDDGIDDDYREIEDFIVDVGEGVRGHDDYGSDSELYGAMNFIRKSKRKSGLTRRNSNKPTGDNQ